jgi:ABC-type branched-subunit amino acid transport system permease subunit
VTTSRLRIGITRSIAVLLAMEVLVFVLGYVAFFAIGAFSGGMTEGSRMASGVFHSWFAFALLGVIGWAVCMVIWVITGRTHRGQSGPSSK